MQQSPKVETSALTAHRIEVSDKTTWRVLQLDAADGLSGWSEFTIAAPEASIQAHLAEVRQRVASAAGTAVDATLVADLLDDWRVGAAIASAVDQAMWDLAARRAGRPLAALIADRFGLDEPGDEVKLYANINRGTTDRSPAGFNARATQALEQGHAAIKIAPFDELTPELCAAPGGRALIDAGLARIAAAADALGGRAALMVDCHWRFDEPAALDLVPALSELGVSWYECPIPEHDGSVAALARIRSAANEAGMQLAGCETMTRWAMFAPYVEGGAYDVIMPDVKYLGRMVDLYDIVQRAQACAVEVALHNPSGPIAHMASVHASAALTPAARLEFQFGESPLFDESVGGQIPSTAGGQTPVPERPGVGVAPLAAFMKAD